MSIWHEQASLIKHSFHHGRHKVVLLPGFHKDETCHYEFQRYVGDQEPGPLGWRPTSENTQVIEFEEPYSAPNLREGKDRAKALLTSFIENDLGGVRSQRAYSKPPSPTPIKTIMHPSGRGRAEIKKWAYDRYEVFVFVVAPDGLYFPETTPSIGPNSDESWGRANFGRRTLADSLEAAEQAALEELDVAVVEAAEMTKRHRDAGGSNWIERDPSQS